MSLARTIGDSRGSRLFKSLTVLAKLSTMTSENVPRATKIAS